MNDRLIAIRQAPQGVPAPGQGFGQLDDGHPVLPSGRRPHRVRGNGWSGPR
jgi:hypothetical protein